MKQRIYRFFIGGEQFQKEFWQEVRVLVLFTLGFTIAFTWRQTFFDISESIVQWITNIQSSTSLSILASLFTTAVCLAVIWVMSRLMENK